MLKTEKQQQKSLKQTPKVPQNPHPTQNLSENTKTLNVKVTFFCFVFS